MMLNLTRKQKIIILYSVLVLYMILCVGGIYKIAISRIAVEKIAYIIVILMLTSAGLMWCCHIIYKRVFFRTSVELCNCGDIKSDYDYRLERAHEIQAAPNEKVTITASDGTLLAAHLYAGTECAPVIIFFYGYRARAAMGASAIYDMANENGWNLVLVTLRAHDESGGAHFTMGVKERYDCSDWIGWATKRFGIDAPLFLMGISMGGAITMMASDLDLPHNLRGIVEDSGFASPKALFDVNLKSNLPKNFPAAIIKLLLELSAILYGHFSLYSVDAYRSLANTKIPVLFIHSDADTVVPVDTAYSLYKACKSEKELVIIHGAGHAQNYIAEPRVYADAIIHFVNKYSAVKSNR